MPSNKPSPSGHKNDKQDNHGQAEDASGKVGKPDARPSARRDTAAPADGKHTTSIGNAATSSTPSNGLTGTDGSSGS